MCFQNIRAIVLRNMHLRILDQAAFEGINNSLRVLYMDNCSLHEIPHEALQLLSSLSVLKITGMPIQHIRNASFLGLSSVEALTLTTNTIHSIELMAFESLKQLKNLDLSGNPLKYVEGLHSLNDVVYLKMDNGFLDEINYSDFPSNLSLTRLYIRNNSIVSLFPDIFMKIHISGFSSEPIPKCVNGYKFSYLWYLYLGYNNLKLEPYNFCFFPKLMHLDLNRNRIKTLPTNVFYGLSLLEVLDLAGNELSYIYRDVLHPLLHMKTLTLTYNRIQKIENEAFLPMQELIQLNLMGNRLISPTKDLMTVPKFLFMLENPISCTCSLWWIMRLNSSFSGPNFKFVPCPNTSYTYVFEYLEKTCNTSEESTLSPGHKGGDQTIFLSNGRIVILAVSGLLLMAGTPLLIVWLCVKKLRNRNTETSNQ